ncbi:conserved exported hypothetical protein [Cupriavidus taiwanensis]|uniref:hypothetical protein n=1 Tax=Cupriavidus taiwanensis TaxID=164546 RepID=UPI000E1ABE9F|nr:hypothetical protein [Cupriavidus taiwanensis]SPA25862.1 conserved exported hypothetical protein [Cupriavidus taiwanensis]
MKKTLAAILALGAALLAQAATTVPPQLINPAGSTAGQAIVSTGPTGAPGWAAVPLTGVTGVLPIANGGTNASTAATARTNLGAASTASNTFSGNQTIAASTPALTINDTSGAASTSVAFSSNGSARWVVTKNSADTFRIDRYVSGTLTDNPFSISNSTGVAAFSARPTFAGATPWDSANLANPASTTGNLGQFASTTSAQLATVISNETGSGSLVFGTNPTISGATISGGNIDNTPIGVSTASIGRFVTLTTTSTITPNSVAGIVGTTTNDSAQAGSVGEYVTNSATGVSLTSGTSATIAGVSLTAGDWEVSGVVTYVPAGGTTITGVAAGINTTANTMPADNTGAYNTLAATLTTGGAQAYGSPTVRVSLSATTSVYLIGRAFFGVSTMSANGFIRARRVR